MTSPHHMTFCYEPWAVRRFMAVSAKSAPAPYETPPHSGVLPVSVSKRRCRSTRSAVRRRQGQPDPVGGIPSSGSPLRPICRPRPDPLQAQPGLIGAGRCPDQVPLQCPAELPDLKGEGKRKDRPGSQDPLRVGHPCLPMPGGAILVPGAFLAILARGEFWVPTLWFKPLDTSGAC